jgi:hypothetical protein
MAGLQLLRLFQGTEPAAELICETIFLPDPGFAIGNDGSPVMRVTETSGG